MWVIIGFSIYGINLQRIQVPTRLNIFSICTTTSTLENENTLICATLTTLCYGLVELIFGNGNFKNQFYNSLFVYCVRAHHIYYLVFHVYPIVNFFFSSHLISYVLSLSVTGKNSPHSTLLVLEHPWRRFLFHICPGNYQPKVNTRKSSAQMNFFSSGK